MQSLVTLLGHAVCILGIAVDLDLQRLEVLLEVLLVQVVGLVLPNQEILLVLLLEVLRQGVLHPEVLVDPTQVAQVLFPRLAPEVLLAWRILVSLVDLKVMCIGHDTLNTT